MITLENKDLSISVNLQGAELSSIYGKEEKREYLWEKDEQFWNRYSPILFPNVGKTYGNIMRIEGQSYPTKQHGFARDRKFELISKTDDSLKFSLKADEKTLEVYPYVFELILGYTLKENRVIVSYEIINQDDQDMYYTIGAHPAFRIPFDQASGENLNYGEYSLYFGPKDRLQYLLADPVNGCARSELYDMKLDHGMYKIGEHSFDFGARIFDHQIEEVTIIAPDGKQLLTLHSPSFPSYGIWSVPGAKFICLEPWLGRCDDVGFQGELKEKPMVNHLKKGGIDKFSYEIICHKG